MEQQTNMGLQQLIKQLAVMPKTATHLFSEHNTLWQSLYFNKAQMALLLRQQHQRHRFALRSVPTCSARFYV